MREQPDHVGSFPSDRDALIQVQTGRSEAAFTQDAVGAYNAKNIGGGTAFEIGNSEALLPVPVGIVFAKEVTQLRDAFQAALKEVIASGAYEEILAKWDMSTGSFEDATINGAE